jgi:hypothetical protein
MNDCLNNRQGNVISRNAYWLRDDADSKQQYALVGAQSIDSRAFLQRIMASSPCELLTKAYRHLNMVVGCKL